MKRYVFTVTCVLTIFWAHPALSRPTWISSIPKDDFYKWYVGRASEVKNESLAFKEAYRDASEQAIRENFGVRTRVQSQTFESTTVAEMTKRTEELSQNVDLRGLEQINHHKEENEGSVSVWVLFRYKKSVIERERHRLSSTREEKRTSNFSEGGNPLDSEHRKLEVVTEPPGATITIDDVPINYFETPVHLSGKFNVGPHRIKIEHPHYETIEEPFLVVPRTTTRIFKVLKRSPGALSIATVPSDAKVFLDGRMVGTTPISNVSIPSGQVVRLEISHPETERYFQNVQVAKDAIRELEIPLLLKPAYISVESRPPGAEVSLSPKVQKSLRSPLRSLQIEPGEYTLAVSKDGYTTYETEVSLKGGEKHIHPMIQLQKVGYLTVRTDPAGAALYINERELEESTPFVRLEAPSGRLSIRLRKGGYEPYRKWVTIKSGEEEVIDVRLSRVFEPETITYQYRSQSVEPESEPVSFQYRELDPEYVRHAFSFNFLLLGSTVTSLEQGSFGFGASYTWRFSYRFAIEADLSYLLSGSRSYQNGLLSHQGVIARVGIPFFVAPSSGIFISPEWIKVSKSHRVFDAASIDESYTSSSQDGFGGSFGWAPSFADPQYSVVGGMVLRIGVHSYSQPTEKSRSTALSLGLGFSLGK